MSALPNLPAGCEWPKRPDDPKSGTLQARLRGQYGIGPPVEGGGFEFGVRQFPTCPIQTIAADYIDALERLIPQVAEAARREEREACALLHENLDVDCGVEPMSVAIEYRDKIRARGEPC